VRQYAVSWISIIRATNVAQAKKITDHMNEVAGKGWRMVGQQMREADLGSKSVRETELYFFWEREYDDNDLYQQQGNW
jgi:hypothetical protein